MTHPEFKMPAPNVFVQWKGTDVCADFHCKFGSHQHICNEMFMYYIQCAKCKQNYRVPNMLQLEEVGETVDHFGQQVPVRGLVGEVCE